MFFCQAIYQYGCNLWINLYCIHMVVSTYLCFHRKLFNNENINCRVLEKVTCNYKLY